MLRSLDLRVWSVTSLILLFFFASFGIFSPVLAGPADGGRPDSLTPSIIRLIDVDDAAYAVNDRTKGEPSVVVVLHTAFVSVDKFDQLRKFAESAGIALRHIDVEAPFAQEPLMVADALKSAALLILDVPRPSDRDAVSGWLAQALNDATRAGVPTLTVGGGRPEWEALSAPTGRALVALYGAGGQENYTRFFERVRAIDVSGDVALPDVAPPVQLPATGFYHPDAPGVFKTLTAFLAWHSDRQADRHVRHQQAYPMDQLQAAAAGQRPTKGRVAFMTHRSAVADMLTRELDTLIARTEAAGMVPIVFWHDTSDAAGLTGVLGNGQIDVLVNMTHMQDGAARRKDFIALDIPVIQTLRFREGEAAAWPGAPSGVSSRTTAVFLAGPESWGIIDPIVLSASTAGRSSFLPAQLDALIDKLERLVALRHTPAPDKRLALMFWNYPAGEKNLGASHLNLPRSIVSIQRALAADGYDVGEAVAADQVIAAGQRMLGALYGTVSLDDLLAENLADLYPLADYERWLASLPADRRQAMRLEGPPAGHSAVREIKGKRYFVVPRWQLGKLVVMPQTPRHLGAHGHYHDTAMAPDHLYMASYLYLQHQHQTHALVHLGTHGTQEWLPGKDRGLAASDYPWLAVGSMPVFYPYIQDNVAEAVQAKRRGRAVTISHQTPPFAPAGLYDQLRDAHHLIHEWEQVDEGGVRERVAAQIHELAAAAHLYEDVGWTADQAEQDFDGFLHRLHDHLHDVARTAMPLGLHTFGQPAPPEHRASTIMQQLGEPFLNALGLDEETALIPDPDALTTHPAYRQVQQILGSDDTHAVPPELNEFVARIRRLDAHLQDTQENEALLAGLAGRMVLPGSGGDPIRSPDVPSGRNLYAFEADKIPARAAYDAGGTAYAQLVQAFKVEHAGAWPKKLAFSLWASEAVRHLGVTEAQVLHALGLRPVWDAGGRVIALDIIPAAELGRPRTDVVVQATGVYRDQFDGFMRMLDDALATLAQLDEPDNLIYTNNLRIAAAFKAEGLSEEAAERAARARIFSNAPGEYGTGVPDLALRSTEWENDNALAEQFLLSSRYAYGSGVWGETPANINVLAAHLKGTEAAVMSRSSNLHGVLSTDHPFEFLGGLSSAVRHLDGKAPQLLISDLRSTQPRTASLAQFLSEEMRARYLNPHWIGAMQKEGYAGTLEVLNATNNLFGWQAMDATTVRADQWQAMFDTYVADTRGLGTQVWFESDNPTAQAQVIERMAEAIRKGYWDASDETRQQLAERWETLRTEHAVTTGAEKTQQFIAEMAQGYGLDAAAPAPDPILTSNSSDAVPSADDVMPDTPLEAVQGRVLTRVEDAAADDSRPVWALLFMLLLIAVGAALQVFQTPSFTARREPR